MNAQNTTTNDATARLVARLAARKARIVAGAQAVVEANRA